MAEFQQVAGKRGPHMRLWLDIPKRPSEIAQPRVWNKMVKDSVRVAAVYHHDNHIPRHFEHSAARRYGHKKRQQKYINWKIKRFRQATDLVMTGSTKKLWTSKNGYKQIRVGGAAEGGKKEISVTVIYVWGFNQQIIDYYKKTKGNKTRDPNAAKSANLKVQYTNNNRVKLVDMRKEMQTITDDESKTLSLVFKDELTRRLAAYKAGRKRIRG